MKYRQQLVSSCAPASLQEWLAGELERRGIDGVYTRYILSLLLADTIDPAECAHVVTHSRTNTKVSENRLGDKSRHRRLKNWDRRKEQQGLLVHHCQQHVGQCCDCSQSYLDSEQRKKLAAVECLKSASEQKSGIEKLIDEVCAKLKNFQADIETNPDCELHAEIKGVSKHSPAQGQTELYYTAFPALSGKTGSSEQIVDETQAPPQEQEAWRIKPIVWGKENHGCSEKSSVVHSEVANDFEEESESFQNDLGREKNTETDLTCFSEIPLNEFDSGTEYVKTVELENKPLFIVPKMKVPPTKVANITMYTPFTSSVLYQSQGIGSRKVQSEDKGYNGVEKEEAEVKTEVEDFEKGEDSLLSENKPCLIWELLPPNVSLEEADMVTDLASKFNRELAAIWDTGNCIPEGCLSSDNLGFSFKKISVCSPNKDVPVVQSGSVNLFIGSNLPSVWSAKKEDIKILNGQDASELLETSKTVPSVPSTVFKKVEDLGEHNRAMIWSSAEDSDFCLDDGSSLKSCRLDLSEQAWEDQSNQTFEADCEDHCPVFPDFEERQIPLGSSSNCVSPLDAAAELVRGIYNLWESSSPQPPFPAKDDQKPHASAQYGEKVIEWISHQRSIADDDHPASWMWQENRTLTYHKGESRFREVVPLLREKTDVGEQQMLSENKMSLCLEECREGLLDKLEEPEENLLTSPKTHFQPIRQDSSETESLSDALDVVEPEQVSLSPEHCDEQSSLVVETSSEEKMEEKIEQNESGRLARSVSSSMDEMLFLTGDFEDEEAAKVQESSHSMDVLKEFHSNLRPDLLLLEDKSTSTDASCAVVKNSMDEQNILGFAPFRKDQIWSTASDEEQCSDLARTWKWSTADDSEDVTWKTGITEDIVEDAFDNDVKKIEVDCTLEALRKELEEEEEELFRDINFLSDSEDFEATFQGEFPFTLSSSWARVDDEEEIVDVDCQLESQVLPCQWEMDSAFVASDSDFLDDSKIEDPEPVELPSVPAEKALYSTELEKEWYKSGLSFSVQLPKKGKIKKAQCQKQQQQHHQQQQRKPCSFFLEGNCRRSDCKFSHNLGSITCRFWEEGSCFKGVTCPFLHGYASDPEFSDTSSAKCKFALESEADFPSLSTLSSSEPSSKQFSKELVVGRIIRPKKKKMGLSATTTKKTNSPLPPK